VALEAILKAPVTAFLALGSNLGDSEAILAEAVRAVAELPMTALDRKSSLYRSPAWGAAAPQPDYVNAVISVRTSLAPEALHRHTAAIEQTHGRTRNGEKNAARTLDIDVLLYGDSVINTDTLTVPHPRMHERDFVLLPLLEIAPNVTIGTRGSARRLLDLLPHSAIKRLGETPLWT
jgi:2-amino-4-hydroxy-6-hydroxymethyldihydropteridine diphosphokinase